MDPLIQLVSEYTRRPGVTLKTRLDSLGMDSLEFLALMLEIQKEFDCTVPDAEYAHLNTVGDILERLS